jgi:Retrotransposon gag protein
MAESKVNLDTAVQHFGSTLKEHAASIETINTNITTFRLQLQEMNDKAETQQNYLVTQLSAQRNETTEQLLSIKNEHAIFVKAAQLQSSELTQQMCDLNASLQQLTSHLTNPHNSNENAPRPYVNTTSLLDIASTPHEDSNPILSSSRPNSTQNPLAPPTNTIVLQSNAPPPTFSGKSAEHPRQFLLLLEQHAKTVNHWSRSTLLQGISQFLTKEALEWYCQLRHSPEMPQDWDDFSELFLNQFHSPLRAAQQKEEWVACKQEEDETINHFSVRLRSIFDEQNPTGTHEQFKQHLFIKMRPDMLALLSYTRSSTLRNVMLEAQKLEQLLYGRNKEQYEREIQLIKPASSANHFRFTVPATTPDAPPTRPTKDRTRPNQTTKYTPLLSQPTSASVTCWRCYTTGHYATDCPWNENNKSFNQSSAPAYNTRPKNT